MVDLTVQQIAKATGISENRIATHWPIILHQLKERDCADITMQKMAVATIATEVPKFAPISEYVSRYNTAPGGEPFALYDKRSDIGNHLPGDGARFKGRGYIQVTGRYNYASIGAAIGVNLVDDPEAANNVCVAAAVLAHFLQTRAVRIRSALHAGDLKAARRAVNGGSHGLERFVAVYRAL